MQTVYKDKNERGTSGKIDLMDVVICIGRIGRCVEGECFVQSRGGNTSVMGRFGHE